MKPLWNESPDLYGYDAKHVELAKKRFWLACAYEWLHRYAIEHPSGFTTELVRGYAYSSGLMRPSNDSCWGAVIKRAIHDGLIEQAGYEQSSNPSRHLNPVRIWRTVR